MSGALLLAAAFGNGGIFGDAGAERILGRAEGRECSKQKGQAVPVICWDTECVQ